MEQLKVKFVGGPRDRKSRTLDKPKAPAVIEVPEDCKFHNVRGRYVLDVQHETVVSYRWEPAK